MILISPTVFASENNTLTEIQNNSITEIYESESDNIPLNEKYNTIYIDSEKGTDDGNGSYNNPVKSISEGLNMINNGGTIYLSGKFSGEGNYNLTLDNTTNNIKFIGNHAIIDGNFTNSFAVINNGIYSFEDISFINHLKKGDGDEFGGVIYNIDGDLTFTNCLFENNSILGVNRGNGGAIDNSGELTVINCIFNNNNVNITNSSGFRKNAADGGAISNLGTLYIYNTNFTNNVALRNGGAIRTQDGAFASIKNCAFINNTAGQHLSGGCFGGAVYIWDAGITITDSLFENNHINDISGYGAQGGAIFSDRGVDKVSITRCEFINNTAEGKTIVNGQSIYIGAVEAAINYCTIDTSIFDISQSISLENNWWNVNNSNIGELIENLPSNVKINQIAELVISTDAESIETGKEINLFVDLFWNGTYNQTNINLIPIRTVYLSSDSGVFTQKQGTLDNGKFNTTFIPNSENILITAKVDDVIVESDLINDKSDFTISCKDIYEGEDATVTVKINTDETGYCLVKINDLIYYLEIKGKESSITIPGLKAGNYNIVADFYSSKAVNSTNAQFTVKNKLDSKMNVTVTENDEITIKLTDEASGTILINVDGTEYKNVTLDNYEISIPLENLTDGLHTVEVLYSGDRTYLPKSISHGILIGNSKTFTKIEVKSSFTRLANDYSIGERGDYIYVTLKDEYGNILSNKSVQIALCNKIYETTTDSNGRAKLRINLEISKSYECTVSFLGDNMYKTSSNSTKIIITSKKTSITASSKVFNAKTKSKTIKVTLKTQKNPYNGKTYLSKGKKITLKINGKTYSAKTNAKGVAKFSIKLTKKGKYNALIKFAGDKTYKSSSKQIKVTIK